MDRAHHLASPLVVAACCFLWAGCATNTSTDRVRESPSGSDSPTPAETDVPDASTETPTALATVPEGPIKRTFDDGGIELLAIYQGTDTDCFLQYFPAKRRFDTLTDPESECPWPAGVFYWDASPAAHAEIVDIAQNHSRKVEMTYANIRGDWEPSGDGPDVPLTPTALYKLVAVFESETHEPTIDMPGEADHFVVSRKEGERIVSFRVQRNGHVKTIEVHPKYPELGDRVLELDRAHVAEFQEVIDAAWETPATQAEDGWSFLLQARPNTTIRTWTFEDDELPDWGREAARMVIDAGWK